MYVKSRCARSHLRSRRLRAQELEQRTRVSGLSWSPAKLSPRYIIAITYNLSPRHAYTYTQEKRGPIHFLPPERKREKYSRTVHRFLLAPMGNSSREIGKLITKLHPSSSFFFFFKLRAFLCTGVTERKLIIRLFIVLTCCEG